MTQSISCPNCGHVLDVTPREPVRVASANAQWVPGSKLKGLPRDTGPDDSAQRQVRAFFYDELKLEAGARMATSEVMELYAHWCEQVGAEPLTRSMIGRRLRTMGVSVTRSQGRKYYSGLTRL